MRVTAANELFLHAGTSNSEQVDAQSFRSCQSSISSEEGRETKESDETVPRSEATKGSSSSSISSINDGSQSKTPVVDSRSPTGAALSQSQQSASQTVQSSGLASNLSRHASKTSVAPSLIPTIDSKLLRTPSIVSTASSTKSKRKFRRRRTTGSLSTAEKRKSSTAMSTKSDITMSTRKFEKPPTQGSKIYPWSRRLSGENHASLVDSGFFNRRDLPKRKLTRLPVHGARPLKAIEDRPFSMLRTPTKFYDTDGHEEGAPFSFGRLSWTSKGVIQGSRDSFLLAAVSEETEETLEAKQPGDVAHDEHSSHQPTRLETLSEETEEVDDAGYPTGPNPSHDSLASSLKKSDAVSEGSEEDADDLASTDTRSTSIEAKNTPSTKVDAEIVASRSKGSNIGHESVIALVKPGSKAGTRTPYQHGPIHIETREDVLRKATVANMASWHENAASSTQRRADKALLEAIVDFFDSWTGVSEDVADEADALASPSKMKEVEESVRSPMLDSRLIGQIANPVESEEDASDIAKMFNEPPRAAPRPPPLASSHTRPTVPPLPTLPPLDLTARVGRTSSQRQQPGDRKIRTASPPAKPKSLAVHSSGISSLFSRRNLF
ncbi:MAG: hypothetical protein M1828_006305 [Chrysothrix sp. TS-e1954]|nr:MAG: hypothetical protein M1828_006305 [Chrysothrix sp. TS-e1954]